MELEQKKEHLLAFAKRMTEGIEYIKNKDDHKGLEMLQPFIDLMKESDTAQVRMFAYYAIAQFRTGHIEGFMETFSYLKEMPVKNEEEQKIKDQVEQMFHLIMNELKKEESE